MTRLASYFLIMAGFLAVAEGGGGEQSLPISRPGTEGVRVAPAGETEETSNPAQTDSARVSFNRQVNIVISRLAGEKEVIKADGPGRRILFPWSGSPERSSIQELHLYNPEAISNDVDILSAGAQGDYSWQTENLSGGQEATIPISPDRILLGLLGERPLVAYVAWSRNGRIELIDQGERLFVEEPAVAQYEIVVEGDPVAVQVEIVGKGISSVHRSPSLRLAVSLTSHTGEGVTRAAWVATDLQPLDGWVLGVVDVNDPEGLPEVRSSIGSDAEGNTAPAEVHLVRLR